ncbi:MAG TPA: polysaccharide deacetylase family protein [Solirubrobacter sp.]|nr:polysaccharide deacetylase family protein [Solirubrobacter sp.]
MRRRRAVAAAVLALTLLLVVVTMTRGSHDETAPATLNPFAAATRIFPPAHLPYVAVAGRKHREVALTFDDGPGPYTATLVRTLRRLHAPGTFFQVGVTEHYFTDAEELQRKDPLVTVGGHTVNHRRMDRLSRAEQAAEIDGVTDILTAAGQPAPTLFRPPYGAFNQTTLDLLRDRGMTMVLWSVDSHDYLRPGVDAIVANVLDNVKPGGIVLMHDAGGERSQTIEALPRIVHALRARGYTLVSVPQLLHDAPPPRKQPKLGVGVG